MWFSWWLAITMSVAGQIWNPAGQQLACQMMSLFLKQQIARWTQVCCARWRIVFRLLHTFSLASGLKLVNGRCLFKYTQPEGEEQCWSWHWISSGLVLVLNTYFTGIWEGDGAFLTVAVFSTPHAGAEAQMPLWTGEVALAKSWVRKEMAANERRGLK